MLILLANTRYSGWQCLSDVQGQWPQALWLISCLKLAATRIRLALLCLLAAFLLADCLGWLAGCWLPASSLGRGGWLGAPSRAAAARTCGRPAAWLPRLADWLLLLAGLTPGCWLPPAALGWLGDGHRFLARAIARSLPSPLPARSLPRGKHILRQFRCNVRLKPSALNRISLIQHHNLQQTLHLLHLRERENKTGYEFMLPR